MSWYYQYFRGFESLQTQRAWLTAGRSVLLLHATSSPGDDTFTTMFSLILSHTLRFALIYCTNIHTVPCLPLKPVKPLLIRACAWLHCVQPVCWVPLAIQWSDWEGEHRNGDSPFVYVRESVPLVHRPHRPRTLWSYIFRISDFPQLFCPSSWYWPSLFHPHLLWPPLGTLPQPSVLDHTFYLCPSSSWLPAVVRHFRQTVICLSVPVPCVCSCLSGASASPASPALAPHIAAPVLLILTKSAVVQPVNCLTARDAIRDTLNQSTSHWASLCCIGVRTTPITASGKTLVNVSGDK